MKPEGLLLLLSLFCGAGGLDLGFERSGYGIGLAVDKNPDSVASYRANRTKESRAVVADVRDLGIGRIDELWGGICAPMGIIGGPPCQSFSQANQVRSDDDPRHLLPLAYADLIAGLNRRQPVPFFVMENVPGLRDARHRERLSEIVRRLESAGFALSETILNSVAYGTPQRRRRLFLVGLNKRLFGGRRWIPPQSDMEGELPLTVRQAIGHLPEPGIWKSGDRARVSAIHPNHWIMRPKSEKFKIPGKLLPGLNKHRSFKTLDWDRPSLTVAYGNREVHVHPGCHRRLSVYEAMLLQGFPEDYVLLGSLSSQFQQVSEAVPPPLAYAVAASLALIVPPSNVMIERKSLVRATSAA